LTIFHTDNLDADTGLLSHRQTANSGLAFSNPGLALVGFGIGGDSRFNQGTDANPLWRDYGGGITFNGFETSEVLLGQGDETLTVETTADRDEVNPTRGGDLDPRSILAIDGGGGGGNDRHDHDHDLDQGSRFHCRWVWNWPSLWRCGISGEPEAVCSGSTTQSQTGKPWAWR
jgi:hypothetical protein